MNDKSNKKAPVVFMIIMIALLAFVGVFTLFTIWNSSFAFGMKIIVTFIVADWVYLGIMQGVDKKKREEQ